jgi:hypothetical protein
VNNIASALVLNSSWNDPATIAELRRCLTGDVRKSVAFLQDEIKKLMRSAVMGFQAFKEAEMEIFGDDSGFVAWDQEILVAMKQDTIQADETMVQGLTPAHTAREIDAEMGIDNEVSIQAAETIAQESTSAPVQVAPPATTELLEFSQHVVSISPHTSV